MRTKEDLEAVEAAVMCLIRTANEVEDEHASSVLMHLLAFMEWFQGGVVSAEAQHNYDGMLEDGKTILSKAPGLLEKLRKEAGVLL